ncbi:hypothetical protein Tco_0378705 [Tanacetum coccineum]
MADPNSPMPVARRAVDELIEVSGETEPSRYMKFFDVQQIVESRRFLNRMRDEVQTSRTCLSELEAINDAGELFDTLMSLRDDKQVESNKLSLLNEMIAMVEEFIATKEDLVRSGNCLRFIMNGHCVCVDVSVILEISTVAPTFDPVRISAGITNWPRSVIIRRVPLHRPWLRFTFRKSIIGSPFFKCRAWGGIPGKFKEFRNSTG